MAGLSKTGRSAAGEEFFVQPSWGGALTPMQLENGQWSEEVRLVKLVAPLALNGQNISSGRPFKTGESVLGSFVALAKETSSFSISEDG